MLDDVMSVLQARDVNRSFSQLNMDCDEVTQLYDARFNDGALYVCLRMNTQ